MRAGAAIGTTLDGQRPETRARVEYGEVTLACRWTFGVAALRGAVCAAVPDAHVDFHGHLEDGTTRQTHATVLYREGPRVWAYGPRALDHLRAVAVVRALRLPGGGVVEVEEAELRTGTTDVGVDAKRWHRYTVTAYFPSSVAYARRPRQAGPERVAWAGQALASSIRMWLENVGLETWPHVQVHDLQDQPLRWREDAVRGFSAQFVSNAILPPGVGLGQHVAEGFGECR